MISELAIEKAEQVAQATGFGPRDDYPFVGASATSAGDWKGHSVVVCVFADREHADTFVGQCLEELDDLGGEISGQVHPLGVRHGGEMYVAAINGIDLIAKSESGR